MKLTIDYEKIMKDINLLDVVGCCERLTDLGNGEHINRHLFILEEIEEEPFIKVNSNTNTAWINGEKITFHKLISLIKQYNNCDTLQAKQKIKEITGVDPDDPKYRIYS